MAETGVANYLGVCVALLITLRGPSRFEFANCHFVMRAAVDLAASEIDLLFRCPLSTYTLTLW
jgi:hypothetical protein